MDKIKTVKIKNPDGSVSEETYTISVDAKDVDMRNGKDLQDTVGDIDIDKNGSIAEQLKKYKNYDNDIKDLNDNIETLNKNVFDLQKNIEKKVYFFNTVADMKSANLKVGDCVKTLGYYSLNDNGGAEYKIVNSSVNYCETLQNGLKAELIFEKGVYLTQLGVKNNDNITSILNQLINNYNINYIYCNINCYIDSITIQNNRDIVLNFLNHIVYFKNKQVENKKFINYGKICL